MELYELWKPLMRDGTASFWQEFYVKFYQAFIEGSRWKQYLNGVGTTLLVTAMALTLGILLGIVVAVIRTAHDQQRTGHKNPILGLFNGICKVYVTVIRGTPMMVQLLIMGFVIFSFSRNYTMVGALTLGINSGAYVSEIICIVYLLLQGVGDGSQPLMSQFYGAGEEKSLKQTKTLAYEFSMVLAVISAILIYLLCGKIGLLFGSSAEVNAGVIKVMPIFLVSVPFDAITRVSTAAFYATEKSVLSYVLTFIEPIIMLVLALMLPPVFGGQIMIWWSTVFAKVITASVSIVLSVRYSAQRNR